MSTNLNSLSGVILQDFIKPCLGGRQMSEKAASTTMKVIVVVVGTFCTAMVFLVDKLGAIIQVSKNALNKFKTPIIAAVLATKILP